MSQPLFRVYYNEKKGLVIKERCPADGRETRPERHWKDPHSSLAVMNVSPRASLLRAARTGDDKAAEVLVNCIADEVFQHAWVNKDKVCVEKGKDFLKVLAEIAVYECIHDERLSHRECGRKLGVNHRAYARRWEKRVNAIFAYWCDRLIKELRL